MPGIMGIMALCLCSHCTELLTGGKTLAKTQQSRHRPPRRYELTPLMSHQVSGTNLLAHAALTLWLSMSSAVTQAYQRPSSPEVSRSYLWIGKAINTEQGSPSPRSTCASPAATTSSRESLTTTRTSWSGWRLRVVLSAERGRNLCRHT